MKKKKFKRLCFIESIQPRGVASNSVIFHPTMQGIYIELAPEEPKEDSATVGIEGLGCEFFTETNNRLYAMYLEMLPFDVVDLLSLEILSTIINEIGKRSNPGQLILKTPYYSAINPDGVWLSRPLGTALYSFDGAIIEPDEAVKKQFDGWQCVRVGPDVNIVLERETGKLEMAMVKNFHKNQMVFEIPLSQEKYGQPFMDVMNSLHLQFLADPEPKKFDKYSMSLISQFKKRPIRDNQIKQTL